jgi:hypothetical protein
MTSTEQLEAYKQFISEQPDSENFSVTFDDRSDKASIVVTTEGRTPRTRAFNTRTCGTPEQAIMGAKAQNDIVNNNVDPYSRSTPDIKQNLNELGDIMKRFSNAL